MTKTQQSNNADTLVVSCKDITKEYLMGETITTALRGITCDIARGSSCPLWDQVDQEVHAHARLESLGATNEWHVFFLAMTRWLLMMLPLRVSAIKNRIRFSVLQPPCWC